MKVFTKNQITESCQKIEGHSPAPFPFFIGFGTSAEATKVMKFLEKAIEQPNLNIIDQNPKSKIEAAYREGVTDSSGWSKKEDVDRFWNRSEIKKSTSSKGKQIEGTKEKSFEKLFIEARTLIEDMDNKIDILKRNTEAAYREGWYFNKIEPTNNVGAGWNMSEAKKSLSTDIRP